MTINFPNWAKVTPCEGASQSHVEHSQHGIVRHELKVTAVPCLVGISRAGRMFPAAIPSDPKQNQHLATPCGTNCPNAGWVRVNG